MPPAITKLSIHITAAAKRADLPDCGSTDGVTFNVLRGANQRRQQEWPGNEKADVPFRALEVAGEAGGGGLKHQRKR